MTEFTVQNLPNPWARISEVAAKLNVKPRMDSRATIVVTGADGEQYDIWEVVVAFLDRLDAEVKR